MAVEKESSSEHSASNFAVGRSFMWMAWSAIASVANSVVIWIAFARTRDVTEVSHFAVVMGVYALFVSICTLGLVPFFVDRITRNRSSFDAEKSSRFLNSSLLFMSLSGVGSALLMILVGTFATNSSDVLLSIVILSVALVPTGQIIIWECNAIACGRSRTIAIVSSTENILRTGIPLLLILGGFGLPAISASFVAVRFVALAAYSFESRTDLALKLINRVDLRSFVRAAPTFAGTIITASIMWQVPAVLLGRFSSEFETAKYGTASRFMIPASILLASYADVIQPHLSFYAEKSGALLGRELRKRALVPLALAFAAAVGSNFAAAFVLRVMFGERYAEGASTLNIFAICLIPYCIVMVVARALVTIGAQRVDLLANIIGVVVFLLIAFFSIPSYGAAGVAVAQLIGFTVMATVEVGAITWLLRRSDDAIENRSVRNNPAIENLLRQRRNYVQPVEGTFAAEGT